MWRRILQKIYKDRYVLLLLILCTLIIFYFLYHSWQERATYQAYQEISQLTKNIFYS